MTADNEVAPSRGRYFRLPGAVACMALAAPAVYAEAGNPLNDTVSLSVGGFLLDTKTKIRVDGEVQGTGDEFDAERDLGLDDSNRVRFDGYWRMTPRQKLRLMWFSTDNSASKTLERTIDIGDETYFASAEVEAGMKTTVTALSYEFDFLQRENYELGVTGGLHNLKFDFHISAEGGGQQLAAETTAEANGPLPVIGIHGVWRINEQWYVDYGAQFFKISFDVYDGRITDYTANINWQFSDHFGVGLGWNSFITKLDVDNDRFDGSMRWSYGGARIFVTGSF